MTHQQILERAIRKAIVNGWNYQPFGDRYFPNYISGDRLIEHIASTIDDLRLNAVIFNHDFAKALWGTKLAYGWFQANNPSNKVSELPEASADLYEEDNLAIWQYHLQRMVISPDPIAYLEENMPE